MLLHDLPASERPREKVMTQGIRSLSNAELIALLISSGTGNDSAISLASKILALESDSISAFSGYEPEEFMKIKGIGIAKACILVGAIELGRRIQSCPVSTKLDINNSDDFSRLFAPEMRYLNKEIVRIVMVDIKMKVIGKCDVSIGGISDASAHPREIFAPAIKKGAAAIIVAHNHPSGIAEPSSGDLSVTKQLADSGKLLGIQLLDHLIIGDGYYTSIKSIYPELF